MLIQIENEKWLNCHAINCVKTASFWVHKHDGSIRWMPLFNKKEHDNAIREETLIKKTGTLVNTSHGDYYLPCPPQKFIDYLDEIGVTVVSGSKYFKY